MGRGGKGGRPPATHGLRLDYNKICNITSD
jgi:hypothetical protein